MVGESRGLWGLGGQCRRRGGTPRLYSWLASDPGTPAGSRPAAGELVSGLCVCVLGGWSVEFGALQTSHSLVLILSFEGASGASHTHLEEPSPLCSPDFSAPPPQPGTPPPVLRFVSWGLLSGLFWGRKGADFSGLQAKLTPRPVTDEGDQMGRGMELGGGRLAPLPCPPQGRRRLINGLLWAMEQNKVPLR